MINLYRILKWISYFAYFPIILVLYYVLKAIKGLFNKQHLTFSEWIEDIGEEVYTLAGNLTKNLIIFSSVALLLTSPTIHQFVGINNIILKPEGTYCFYVEAKKQGEKTYTLPAKIRVEEEREEVQDNKERIYRFYYIEKVYFPNGGWLDTGDLDEVELNEARYFYDDNDDEWELTLLNEHAYTPEVIETNNATWIQIVFLSIALASIFIVLYAISKRKRPAED